MGIELCRRWVRDGVRSRLLVVVMWLGSILGGAVSGWGRGVCEWVSPMGGRGSRLGPAVAGAAGSSRRDGSGVLVAFVVLGLGGEN